MKRESLQLIAIVILGLAVAYLLFDRMKKAEFVPPKYETMTAFIYDTPSGDDVRDINEYTLKGWEIKNSRRAFVDATITGYKYKRWGTEYLLQRQVMELPK